MKIFATLVSTSQCLSVIWWDSDPACNLGHCWETGNKQSQHKTGDMSDFPVVSCSHTGHLKLYAVQEMCLELVLTSSKTGCLKVWGLGLFYWKEKWEITRKGQSCAWYELSGSSVIILQLICKNTNVINILLIWQLISFALSLLTVTPLTSGQSPHVCGKCKALHN